ncbi:APC family permease [Ureibacillus sp. NPDC094379]
MNNTNEQNQLKRTLKLSDLVIFGLIFMSPVAVMSLFGVITIVSEGHAVLAYIIGFVAMLFTAYSFGKMVQAFPVSGSTYTYSKLSLHPKIGFLAGWAMLLDYLLLPVLTLLLSSSFAYALLPSVPAWVWIIIFAIPVTIINVLGVEVAAKANFILVSLQIIAIISFVISAINYKITGGFNLINLNAIYNPETFSIGALIGGAAIVTVAFLGFDAITTMAEETKASGKKIGLAVILACAVQTLFFIIVSYFGVSLIGNFNNIENPDSAFFEVLSVVSGQLVQTLITMVIISALVASALASQSAASRLLFGMGRDRVLPNGFFGYIHPKTKTPSKNILLMGVLGVIGALTFTLQLVSDLLAFGGLVGFLSVNLSVIYYYYIRKKEKNILGNLIVPSLGIIVCTYLLFNISTIGKITGIAWLVIGLIYIFAKEHFLKKKEPFPENKDLQDVKDVQEVSV